MHAIHLTHTQGGDSQYAARNEWVDAAPRDGSWKLTRRRDGSNSQRCLGCVAGASHDPKSSVYSRPGVRGTVSRMPSRIARRSPSCSGGLLPRKKIRRRLNYLPARVRCFRAVAKRFHPSGLSHQTAMSQRLPTKLNLTVPLAFREGPHSRIALQPHFSGRQIERVAFPTSVSKISSSGN
jgi:hypothetical protein